MKELLEQYKKQEPAITKRLQDFKEVPKDEYFYELLFCLLTPQSNAKSCWAAVQELKQLDVLSKKKVVAILKKKTRFHNNKASYVIDALNTWDKIKSSLSNKDRLELRNALAENVRGLGLKEASHYLRNIGKSENKVAILDRHILRNLKAMNVISEDNIKNKKDYFVKEQQFMQFAQSLNIPIDALDLLFWSKETGEIFK